MFTVDKLGRKPLLIIGGVGMLVGFWIAGKIVDKNLLAGGSHGWQDIWIFPAVFAVVVMLIFALLFKNEKVEYKS